MVWNCYGLSILSDPIDGFRSPGAAASPSLGRVSGVRFPMPSWRRAKFDTEDRIFAIEN